jgi:hypothetical protein
MQVMRFSGLCAAACILGAATAATAPAAAGSARAAYRHYFEARNPAGPRIAPSEVRALIRARGASGAVQRLDRPGNARDRWDSVLRGIASGSQAWLDLAPEIAAGTDAGTAEEYAIVLSDALVGNATGTLRLVLAGAANVEDVCIESGIETPLRQRRAYDAAAIEAVQAVTAPDLQAAKTACLASLRADQAAPAAR